MSDTLLCRIEDGVALLTLNRPGAHNAIDPELRVALKEALMASDTNPDIGCIVLTGEGRSFCAGVDLKSLAETEAAQFTSDPASDIAACSTPVIGAINGACVGGGLEIALACDFLIAADVAVFADTHARLGYVATWGLYERLAPAVGVRRATELCLTARRVGADEAVAIGIANRIVPRDELISSALETAQLIASVQASVRITVLGNLRASAAIDRP
jgi:enoyl-CoA hydratase